MALACIHRVKSEHKVKHDTGDGEWLCLARAYDRVRTCRLVFENESITEPYKPTQERKRQTCIAWVKATRCDATAILPGKLLGRPSVYDRTVALMPLGFVTSFNGAQT
eukprot:5603615-Pleurochrysis_carterae.AAC.2